MRLINLWKECILINALNNSVQNSEQSDFEQLPSKLNFIPQEVKYVNPEGENTILNYLNQQAKSITTTRWKTVSKHKNQFALEITEKIR